jgi:hypothetical protein
MNGQTLGPKNAQHSPSGHLDRVMQPEQFTQVLDAILSGKYSWACVLILRFAGYNPLHYIPYRTYNRIVKDSYLKGHAGDGQVAGERPPLLKIVQDLNHLEAVEENAAKIKGGAVEGDAGVSRPLFGLNWWHR